MLIVGVLAGLSSVSSLLARLPVVHTVGASVVLKDILEADIGRVLIAGSTFVGTVVPGVLTIFVFDRPLFLELDLLKLLLLSSAIGTALALVPVVAVISYVANLEDSKAIKVRPENQWMLGQLFSLWASLMPMALNLFYSISLWTYSFLLMLIWFAIFVLTSVAGRDSSDD